MAPTPQETPGPDVMEIFDEASHGELVCRVCGSLVPRGGEFARVHWDWHEASNGA
jgi:hypothetical protein